MATLSRTRYRGGPLSDYSQSFDGLGQHYAMQQPGATQHEQLQNEAVNQQQAAGGFYRPGFEPRPAPAAPILAPPPAASAPTFGPDVIQTQPGILELKPTPYDAGAGNFSVSLPPAPVLSAHNPPHAGEAGWLDIADKAGAAPIVPRGTMPPPDYRGQTFARPTGMTSDSPTLAGGGAMPTGGRPMTDPNRIIDTVARGHRNDPRTQIAVADYNRGDADRAAAGEAAAEKARVAAQVHQDLLNHQANETQRKALAAAGFSSIGQGQPLVPTVAAQRLQAEQDKAQVTFHQKLYQQNYAETLRQLTEQRKQQEQQQKQQQSSIPGVAQIPGTNLAVPTLGGKRIAGVPTLQQSSGFPDMHTPSVNLPWGGQVPSLTFPGAPTQYKPLEKPTPPLKPEKPIFQHEKDDNGKVTHWHFVLGPDGKYIKRKVEEEGAAPDSSSTLEDRIKQATIHLGGP